MGLFEVYISILGTIFVINSVFNTLISNVLLDDINRSIDKCIGYLINNDYSSTSMYSEAARGTASEEDTNISDSNYVIKTMYS